MRFEIRIQIVLVFIQLNLNLREDPSRRNLCNICSCCPPHNSRHRPNRKRNYCYHRRMCRLLSMDHGDILLVSVN